MRVMLQPAYVLHRRYYRETSLLLELFTPEFGRVGVVARGARSPRSPQAGLLQPFRPLLVSWAGRGELFTLAGVESAGLASRLAGRSLFNAYYLNELLLRLLQREDPHGALFHAYGETLHGVDDPSLEQRVLRLFEKRLLQELGYGLALDRDAATGRPIQADACYDYQPEKGPVAMATEDGFAGVRVHGSSLLSLAREELNDPASLRESKQLMRAVLARYLGDKPLKSRELFNGMTGIDGGRGTPSPLVDDAGDDSLEAKECPR